MVAIIAGTVGLLAAPLLVRGLLPVAPAYYGALATFEIDALVIATALLLCVFIGLTVSLPPLVELLRVNLRDTLR